MTPPVVGNKLKRAALWAREKERKKKDKQAKRDARKKKRTRQQQLNRDGGEIGEIEPPAQRPRTLESTREVETTAVAAGDAEVLGDEADDEFAAHERLRRAETSPMQRGAAADGDADSPWNRGDAVAGSRRSRGDAAERVRRTARCLRCIAAPPRMGNVDSPRRWVAAAPWPGRGRDQRVAAGTARAPTASPGRASSSPRS